MLTGAGESALRGCRSQLGLSTRKLDRGAHPCRRRLVRKAGDESPGLLDPALRQAQLGKARQRQGVQWGQRVPGDLDRRLQLGLRQAPPPRRHQHVAIERAAVGV